MRTLPKPVNELLVQCPSTYEYVYFVHALFAVLDCSASERLFERRFLGTTVCLSLSFLSPTVTYGYRRLTVTSRSILDGFNYNICSYLNLNDCSNLNLNGS